MKQLNLLAEVDFSPLSKMEALSTKGGSGWISVGGQYMYCFDEVTVVGEDRREIDWTRTVISGLQGFETGFNRGGGVATPVSVALPNVSRISNAIGSAVKAAYGDYLMQSYGY